jgi:hypothetical protein
MTGYVSRDCRRNRAIRWLRVRLAALDAWLDDQVEYDPLPRPGHEYIGRYSFYNSRTGEETPTSPRP